MHLKVHYICSSIAAIFISLSVQAQDYIPSRDSLSGVSPCNHLISEGFANRILLPDSSLYEPQVQSYWARNARLHPLCFFLPKTTAELAAGITLLYSISRNISNVADDWHIAIRSGGHASQGNNIVNGLTIDFSHMNGSWYDASRRIASLEPGGRWRDVYANLLHTSNMTVTGGRDGDVGVAGYLLGGGNSYYSGENGFGCDTVVNYEVVLANGTVVYANARENKDLFKALKGGGMNFGIVTRFDVMTMSAVDLAYGRNIIAVNHSSEVIDAVVEFTEHAEERRTDHMFALFMHSPDTKNTIVSIRVNTEGNLNTTGFDALTEIPAESSTWERMTLAAVADSSQIAGGTMNKGVTLTFSNHPVALRQAEVLWNKLLAHLTSKIGADNFMAQMFFQPLPAYYSELGRQNGGNVLGLDRNGGNAILWTAGFGLFGDNATAFAIADSEMTSMVTALEDFTVEKGMSVDFVYLNYADATQDPLGSYGPANFKFMQEVASRYDPEGWWQRMVPGGFKLINVNVRNGS